MTTVKIGFIKYANSLPIYHSFDSCGIEETVKNALKKSGRAVSPGGDIEFEVIYDSPARLNKLISEGGLDIATISTYEYVRNRAGLQMIGNIGICANNSVMSVLLISKKDMNQLSGGVILLSDESASAVSLLKILTEDYFDNDRIKFITGEVRAEEIDRALSRDEISAVMAIGDEALKYYQMNKETDKKNKFFDLCTLWNRFTSLPFVFGVFAARADFYFGNKIICDLIGDAVKSKVKFFNSNKADFIDFISKRSKISEIIAKDYYEILSYDITQQHIMALEEYEKRLKKIKLLP